MKKLKCLAVLFVGLLPTFAFAKAKVEPLQFAGASTHEQNQARWDSLMKYKVWGTDYIVFLDNVHISDSVGYTGTKGNLTLSNPSHTLGGPILVGGDMVFDNATYTDKTGGSVRVVGNLRLSNQDGNKMDSVWCVGGSITSQHQNKSDSSWNVLLDGDIYTNETAAYFTKKKGDYSRCPETVPPLEDLSVPYLPSNAWPQNLEDLLMTKTDPEIGYIHVPPDTSETNNYGTYDKYFNRFVISGTKNKALYVVMPPGGKLTRIFSKNGFEFDNAVNDLKIQVVYVTEGTKFADGKWDLTDKANFTYVTNSDYSGNLLFYTDKPIRWNYWQGASFQGTWMTTDTIGVGGHFKLAGQIVAKSIYFYADITGDFKYMPFDPPWIDINPEARTWGTLYEGVSGKQPLTIRLNEAPPTEVTFKYCFIFTGDQANNRDTDPDSLHAFASLADVVTTDLPVCNGANSTNYKTVSIPKGKFVPTDTVGVVVQDDQDEEWGEMFTIRVFDMVGAVLPNKMRKGEFLIEIVDDDRAPLSKDTTFVGIEDEDNAFVRFPALTGNGQPLTDFFVKIESLPMHNSSVAGKLIYDGNVVDAATIAAGLIIPSADIGKLSYRGNENAYGNNIASFTFRIIYRDVPAENANVVAISLNAVNDGPTVNNPTVKVKENVAGETAPNAVSGKITVNDVDDTQFKYAFDNTDANYAKVTSLYTINSKTGKISVKSGVLLNYESADSLLKIKVNVTDSAATTNGTGKVTVKSNVTIKITDDNDKPVIRDTTLTVAENSAADTEVGKVTAEDEDTWKVLTFSLADMPGNSGAAQLFTINSDGMIKVATGAKLDYETKKEYKLYAIVTDNGASKGFTNLKDTAVVTIKLTDANDPPIIVDIKDDYNVVENTKTGVVFAKFKVVDVDAADGSTTLSATVTDKNPVSGSVNAGQLFKATVTPYNGDTMYVNILVKDSALLDYEALYKADTVSYNVTVSIKDGGNSTVSADTKIFVTDENEAPDAKDGAFTIAENSPAGKLVGTISASDPDTYNATYKKLKYTLVGSSSRYTVAASTGKITVKQNAVIDYETTPNHKDTIKVKVTDKNGSGLSSRIATIVITITNTNEDPELKCITGDTKCNGPFEIAENSATGTVIHTFAITDVDANDAGHLTVDIVDKNGSNAKTLFDVKTNAANTEMIVSVKDKSKLNYEAVDSTYVVYLIVKDAGNAADTLERTIKVIDVNETPTLAGKTVSLAENSPKNKLVATLTATDPDTKHVTEFGHLEYSIITDDMPFRMDSNKVRVEDSTKLDYETTPIFKFNVEVKNCTKNASTGKYTDGCLMDTAAVTVRLSNVNEEPELKCISGDTKCNGPFEIAENSATGTEIHTFAISDIDADDAGQLTVDLVDKNGRDAKTLFDVKTNTANTEMIVFVKDSSKLDYETVDAQYVVYLIVKDAAGAADTLVRTIKVKDVNEAPSIQPLSKTIAENLPNGTKVGDLVASDPDTKNASFRKLKYTILGADTVPFRLDSNVVKVSDSSKLDYEKQKVFKFKVQVSDGQLQDTALVTITLTDVDERPKIIVDDDEDGGDDTDSLCIAHCDTTNRGSGDEHGKDALTVGVNENSPTGTVVMQYWVYDEDADDVKKLVPSLDQIEASVGGPTANDLFQITKKQEGNRWKIVVTVKDGSLLDYEGLGKVDPVTNLVPQYTVNIILTDPVDPSNSNSKELKDTIVRVIEILDVNESPLFDVWPCEIAENNHVGDSLGRIEHPSDVDSLSKHVDYYDNQFKLVGGDTALFDLKYGEPIDGRPNITLVAKVIFDCETEPYKNKCGVDGAFHVVIDYFDKHDTTNKMRKTVPITLIDVNEKPKILTDSVEVKENVKKGTVVDTVRATDTDLYDTVLTFTLVEDKSGCFDVSKSGVITVKKDNCPDLNYEKNKELPIKVKVTDNGTGGSGEGTLSDTKTIIVKIKDVNEAPEIPDQEFTVPEDTKPGKKVAVIEASDPDVEEEYSTLTFSLIEESEEFDVKEDGTVILKKPLDYEKDSVYVIKVRVTDGELSDTANVTIKVGNVYEQPKVQITLAETVDSSWTDPDTIYINNKSLCIEWVAMVRETDEVLKDTSECGIKLEEGENFIIRKFEDPRMDEPGYDTLVVYVSTATPIVTVSKSTDKLADPNIFTVVEQSAKGDTAFYVNDPRNDIVVTVKDPVEKTKETFTVKLDLDTVKVPSKTYKTVSDIVDHGIALNERASNATHTPVNGEKIAVTYTEKVNGKEVQITYYTDDKGELLENADGVVEMTVSYTEKINGVDVTISYQADAVTGNLIKTSGGYAKSEKSKDGKGGKGKNSKDAENKVVYTVSYEYVDDAGNFMTISYGVDADGDIVRNEFGSIGYELTYTYTNKYGNASTQSIFVVLDQAAPVVKILYPTKGEVIYANYVDVKWTVDLGDGRGPIVQDTLVTQSLNKGGNGIVRFYRDKAGNIASDTVLVVMKNAKDVDISVEKPVTLVTKDKVEEYYAANEPEEGETFAVSIYNPKTEKEVETQVGGEFKTKEGSGNVPYPGLEGHLGPTLGIDTKVPSVNAVGGLATLDDLVNAEGLVALQEVDGGKKITVDEYVEQYCSDEFAESLGSDLSRANLYKTKMRVKIWIYTSLGQFVDHYSFTQELDDPDYANNAGLLTLYFEMKPDRDGNVRTAEGRLMATGAYIYKTEVEMNTLLRCSLPPFEKSNGGNYVPKKKDYIKGSTRRVTEDMLKSFGYKRPSKK